MNKYTILIPLAALALAGCQSNNGGNQAAGQASGGVTGAGSNFVYPVLSSW